MNQWSAPVPPGELGRICACGVVPRSDWGATAITGPPVQVDYASRLFQQLTGEAGAERIRLHDCRHTYATLALQAGVPVKIVSARLGHSSVQLTWDVYSHVLPKDDDAAADVFEAHVYGRVS